MTYQEMLDHLKGLEKTQQRSTVEHHWQAVLSNGFIAFVQGQLENLRKMALGTEEMGPFYASLDDETAQLLRDLGHRDLAKVTDVWESMRVVYAKLQSHSERQGSSGGMVDHGRHTSMPRGVAVTAAAQCYRCGSPAAGQGLCNGCLATQQDWEQDDLAHDRQLADQQRNQIEHQRIQDDQAYYDQQTDFNTSHDYNSDY